MQLDWQTAQEQDLLEYEIEQSRDAISFNKIATAAPYNLVAINNYSITALQGEGLSYYRLKIKETSGKISYSNIITLKMSCNVSATRVYPMPFSNTLTIVLGEGEAKEVALFDVSGKLIKTTCTGSGQTISLNGGGLAPGVYIICIKKKDGTNENVRVMKK